MLLTPLGISANPILWKKLKSHHSWDSSSRIIDEFNNDTMRRLIDLFSLSESAVFKLKTLVVYLKN